MTLGGVRWYCTFHNHDLSSYGLCGARLLNISRVPTFGAGEADSLKLFRFDRGSACASHAPPFVLQTRAKIPGIIFGICEMSVFPAKVYP